MKASVGFQKYILLVLGNEEFNVVSNLIPLKGETVRFAL